MNDLQTFFIKKAVCTCFTFKLIAFRMFKYLSRYVYFYNLVKLPALHWPRSIAALASNFCDFFIISFFFLKFPMIELIGKAITTTCF